MYNFIFFSLRGDFGIGEYPRLVGPLNMFDFVWPYGHSPAQVTSRCICGKQEATLGHEPPGQLGIIARHAYRTLGGQQVVLVVPGLDCV